MKSLIVNITGSSVAKTDVGIMVGRDVKVTDSEGRDLSGLITGLKFHPIRADALVAVDIEMHLCGNIDMQGVAAHLVPDFETLQEIAKRLGYQVLPLVTGKVG